MDSFYFVLPSKSSGHEKIDAWVKQESEHAVREWRRQFRGEPRVIEDTEVTAEHVESANLVLWGTPAANSYLAKIIDRLPVKWSADKFTLGQDNHDATKSIPLLIYPNPENPFRYIVLNSGFTFREYDYLNNARQIAKLPDYAIIDTSVPPNTRYPGKVVTAGFFNEHWQLRAK
jgi:hypothetical protein